jgi:hypothetical protein
MNPSPLFKQQSTFIPQQAQQNAHRGVYYNIFFIVGNVVLIGMVLAWAGLFGYRFLLDQEIVTLQTNLTASSEKALDEQTTREIEEIKALDKRLNSSKPLIEKHLVMEPLFALIDSTTLTNSVRFANFKYEATEEGVFKVTANGTAASFGSLAYQQDVLKKNTSVSDIKFSKFNLDEKSGNVLFNLEFNVLSETLLFKNTVEVPEAITTQEEVEPLPEELLLEEDLQL